MPDVNDSLALFMRDMGEALRPAAPVLFPLFVIWFLSPLTGLEGTPLQPWFFASTAIGWAGCEWLIRQWRKPYPIPHDDPPFWFDRLGGAAVRFSAVIYLAVAVTALGLHQTDSPMLKASFAMPSHFFAIPAVWLPLVLWVVLAASSAYEIPACWRYAQSPRTVGRLINSVLCIAGGVTLAVAAVVFISRFGAGRISSLPPALAAVMFFIGWVCLALIAFGLARWAVVWRGEGGAARERARQHIGEREGVKTWGGD